MNLGEYRLYSPYFALFDELAPERFQELSDRFSKLSEEEREFIASEQLAEQVQLLIEEGTIKPQFRIAVGKIIGLVALGDVAISSVPELLNKIGVSEEDSGRITSVLGESLEVAESLHDVQELIESPKTSTPEMAAMPPMTRPMEDGPKPLTPSVPKANVPERNIIDLRNNNTQ